MFLDGFNRFFGRGKRASAMQWRQRTEAIRKSLPGQLGVLFADMVEPEKILGAPGARHCCYSAPVTFWAMLGQVLRGGSLREAVAEVRAAHPGGAQTLPSASTGTYSDARARLPSQAIEQAHERVLGKMVARSALLEGHRILAVDATSVQLPDTAANQAAFPQPSNQQEGCGFPVMQVVALFDLDTSAMVKLAGSPLRVDEGGLFQVDLMETLQSGDILLGDRHYCTYYHVAKLLAKGADTLFRLHGSRSWPKGRKGDDLIVEWTRPPFGPQPEHISREDWESLPERLTVRYVRFRVNLPGYRTREVRLATTLRTLPAATLAKLYHARWHIELGFDDFKTTLGMDFVEAKSPAMAWKMVLMFLLAHNLIRALILQTAHLPQAPEARRLSFKGTLDALHRFAPRITAASRTQARHLHTRMLETIAKDPLPERPQRIEPRVRKRRPKNYPLMTRPRAQLRNEIRERFNQQNLSNAA